MYIIFYITHFYNIVKITKFQSEKNIMDDKHNFAKFRFNICQ